MVVVVILALAAQGLEALELNGSRFIEFGGSTHPWESFALDNTLVRQGPAGKVLVLRDRSGLRDEEGEDLFLGFEEDSPSLGRYALETPLVITRNAVRLGTGAGVMRETGEPVRLRAGPASLFFPGTLWHDFVLEFWIFFPSFSDGASILSWRGAKRDGRNILNQELRISVRGRRLELRAANFFSMPTHGAPTQIVLAGRSPLLPGRWSHHRFQFHSTTGLLEYVRDGVPENAVYVTSTGHEGGQVFLPLVGELSRPEILLGERLDALLDDFRLSRRPSEGLVRTNTYPNDKGSPIGYAVSPVVDLGTYNFHLQELSWLGHLPEGTRLELQVRAGNNLEWSGPGVGRLTAEWLPWERLRGRGLIGRYFQIRLRLDGDGSGERSPRVERLTARWSTIPEPVAPTHVALREGQDLELSWRPVGDEGVKSYRVYWSLDDRRMEPSRFLTVNQSFDTPWSWEGGERPRVRIRIHEETLRQAGDEAAALALREGRVLYFAVSSVKEIPGNGGGGVVLLSPYSAVVSGRRTGE